MGKAHNRMREKKNGFRFCDPCGSWFFPRLDRGNAGFYCSDRCAEVGARYTAAGTYRICKVCKSVFHALESNWRKCSDCHSRECKNYPNVEGKGNVCA
jgi:hypothetical protein